MSIQTSTVDKIFEFKIKCVGEEILETETVVGRNAHRKQNPNKQNIVLPSFSLNGDFSLISCFRHPFVFSSIISIFLLSGLLPKSDRSILKR